MQDDSTPVAPDALRLGSIWEAIGPFPHGMREHPFLASPLHAIPRRRRRNDLIPGDVLRGVDVDADVDFARRPFDPAERFPSELGQGGEVGWRTFGIRDGWAEVVYRDVRWDQLRADKGWAGLQHTVVLRTRLHVPRSRSPSSSLEVVELDQGKIRFRIDVRQGFEYAFVPLDPGPLAHADTSAPVTWYQGDIYDYAGSDAGTSGRERKSPIGPSPLPLQSHPHPHPLEDEDEPAVSNFARSVALPPGEYTLLVRAGYEIRMFGDPHDAPPAIRLGVALELELELELEKDETAVEVVHGLAVVPDAVDGWLMGEWVSVGVRAHRAAVLKRATIVGEGSDETGGVQVELPREVELVQGQIRPIALRVTQTAPLRPAEDLSIDLELEVDGNRTIVRWALAMRHKHTAQGISPFKMSFAVPSPTGTDAPALVSYAAVVPPPAMSGVPLDTRDERGNEPAVLLVLHGAGVEVADEQWADAVPRQAGRWAVLPQGKTEWGEDWHGGSMDEAWAAREALQDVATKLRLGVSGDTILVGHSNGGQGAWHLAARYPDRIVGVVAAAGWMTMPDYVPYTEWTSRHYADPALLGLLHASLAPYANDLHLTNLTRVPVLAVHGQEDDNVPPRHSRAYVAALRAYTAALHQGKEDGPRPEKEWLRLLEVPKRGHWWEDVLKQDAVRDWLDGVGPRESRREEMERGFELTCVNPLECGGRAGVRIKEVDVPGRMARVEVRMTRELAGKPGLVVKGRNVAAIEVDGEVLRYDKTAASFLPSRRAQTQARAIGPMIRILATKGPFVVCYGRRPSHFMLAKRIAHDIYVNHRVAVDILDERQGLQRMSSSRLAGNVVLIGREEENVALRYLLHASGNVPPIRFVGGVAIQVGENVYQDPGAGIIALAPHPTQIEGLAMIIAGNDDAGLERAARLFPIRTGVPVPEWVVVGPKSDWQGAGGILAAGWWDAHWQWSEAMSWSV